MPQQSILEIELFEAWGIDFMGFFCQSGGYLYIFFTLDCVSMWVEAIFSLKNDAMVVNKFLKKNIFSQFETPRAIISDEGSHFINQTFAMFLSKYNINYKVATT